MAPKPITSDQSRDKLILDSSTSDTATADRETTARSRSEIEDALSGRTAKSNNKARPAPDSTFDLNAPPRRQQVIGGKLTGVSNRPKFGIFSRYSDISVTNWVAFVIVMLILAAFFWPQENNPTQEVLGSGLTTAPQLGETDLSEEEQNDFLESETGNSSLSFSRDNDISRAGDYRQQEAQDLKIRSLLDKAKTEIKNGQYTQPAGENAHESYRAVLAISQRNVEAKQGIDFIIGRFLTSGYSALKQNNKVLAENALNKLAVINKDSDEYTELESAVAIWKAERRVLIILDNAQATFDKGALILPAKGNALYFYQQVLLLDEDNQIALTGVQKIADSYIQLANDAVLDGQFEAASAHLTTVSIIDASHSSIPLIEAMIARAKPLAEKALADQQRQIEEQNLQRLNTFDDGATSQTTPRPENVSEKNDTRTPERQTSEQEAFDKQYLKQGLEAYYKGEYDTALALLQPLADKGIARAQFKIAYMHFLGRGFKRDRSVADSMIRAVLPSIQIFANDQRPWAQSDLGSLYEDGLVLPRNYSNAVYWYRSAAEQGYPGAQTNLGNMYARGRGVAVSRRTAILWFQRAAKQGDRVAQRNLKTMGVIN